MLMMTSSIQPDTFAGKLSCGWSRSTRVWYNKHAALEANYGLEEETPTFKGPLTYKSYCRHLLDRKFWGDKVVLYTVSAMWNLCITVFNSKTDEYRVRHNMVMDHTDINTVYNAGTHYSAAGRLP